MDKTQEILMDLSEAVARVETRLENMSSQEGRIGSLERWRSFLVGAWAVVSLAVAAVWSAL